MELKSKKEQKKMKPAPKLMVETLKAQELDQFWAIFSQIIKNDFPGYSQKVIDHFLSKIYTKYNFHYWLTTDWRIVLLAKENDQIIGFAVLDKPYGGVCFCRWLGVIKDHRKKGVGRQLVKEIINYAQKYGCHKVELASQPQAKKFYQKTGLKIEGERKLSYFAINQYVFGKIIGQPKDEAMIKD